MRHLGDVGENWQDDDAVRIESGALAGPGPPAGERGVHIAIPEAERLRRVALLHELLEACEWLARGVLIPAILLESAWRPALAREGHLIARLAQHLGEDLEFSGKALHRLAASSSSMRHAPGQDRRARGRARRHGAERVTEQHPLARDAVEDRRMHHGVAERTGMRPAPVVAQRQQDVRRGEIRGACGRARESWRECQQQSQAERSRNRAWHPCGNPRSERRRCV